MKVVLQQAPQAFYGQGGNQLLFLGGETGYVKSGANTYSM